MSILSSITVASRRLLFALVVFGVSACESADVPLDRAEIRISNETGSDFDSVRLQFHVYTRAGIDSSTIRTITSGPLRSGESGTYTPIVTPYEYTYDEARVRGPSLNHRLSASLSTADYDKTISLDPGRYTYRMRVERYPATYISPVRIDGSRPDSPSSQVEIRVRNRTTSQFAATTVEFMDRFRQNRTRVEYGPLGPEESSSYAAVTVAFPYAPFEVVIGQDTLRYRVTDYYGLSALEPGRYTMDLKFLTYEAFRDRTELVREGSL